MDLDGIIMLIILVEKKKLNIQSWSQDIQTKLNAKYIVVFYGVMAFNSLTAIGAHEGQLFDKLLWWLVTSTIFVRC